MKTKHLLIIAVFALAFSVDSKGQYTDLLSFSDPAAFGTQVTATFNGVPGSQGASGLAISGSVESGQDIFMEFAASQNWSSYDFAGSDSFSLFMVTPAPNPDLSFSLQLFDSSTGLIETWSGDTGAAAVNGYVDLFSSSLGTGDYSDVLYAIFVWNNTPSASIDTTISTLAVVPEPSTYALLALSGLAFGSYVIRRRRRRA